MESNTNINVSITNGTIFRVVLFCVISFFTYYLWELVLLILTSIVVGSAIEPFIQWLTNRKIPRVAAVILIYVALFATIFILVSIFIPLIFDDFFKLFDSIPMYINSLNLSSYVSDASGKMLSAIKNSIAETFSSDQLIPAVKSLVIGGSSSIVDTAKLVFGGVSSFVFIFVFSFYLAVQEKGIEDFLRLITPLAYENYILGLWKRSKKKIGLWLQGQILLGVLIGVFVFLGLSIIGIKNALALAVFASIFEIIPVFGPILAAMPAVLITFLQSPSLGLIVLGLYVVIQQFENHLIYPLVVRKIVGMPPLISILFLIIGFKLFGFLGMVLAIPTAVVVLEIADDYEKNKRFIQPTIFS
ncbi:MAG: AI-2E family transporter [bacterium]